MAFVPKIHNREVPVANHPVASRSQQETHGRHLRSLYEMGPRVETRWGGSWNGVRDQKQPAYTHVRHNLKRAQIQDERFAEIELENTVLLGKLSKILRRSRNPTVGTRDWTGGLRLTPNQVPVIDHWISADTTAFGAAVEPSSLNLQRRRQERERIEVENRALVARLQSCRPTYDRSKFEEDSSKRERWLATHAMPRPLSPLLPGQMRPSSAQDAPTPAALQSSIERMGGSGPIARSPASTLRPLPRTSGGSGGGKGRAPMSGKGRGGRPAPSPGVDASVLSVLDLLSRHMRGASSSLADMRVARDSLMEAVHPLGDDVIVEDIDAGGVPTELVTFQGAGAAGSSSSHAATTSKLLVLVHGGMFVTGSPRAGRHLAAKLSELLGVPVATPKLRLAPEHPYPAALDDLSQAYAFLSANAVGGASAPPSQMAIFAESSGGALALSLLSRQSAGSLGSRRTFTEPSAIVLGSPWLDMTCSGKSYATNEARDPVMQRKRLLGIARAYLGESGVEATDPVVSPILGNAPAFIGLPPTLVQVGLSEVLIDDSYELESLAKAAGADVRIQLWDGVLHAWHTFFPLMPRAAQALEQAATFLAEALGLPPPAKGASGSAVPMPLPMMSAEDDEEARARAAVRLQAITRGRNSRKEVTKKKPKKYQSSVGPTTVKWTSNYDDEQTRAVTKMQSRHRGNLGRKNVAATYGNANAAEKRALAYREVEVEQSKVGFVEAGALADEQEMRAAVKMQAFARGHDQRRAANMVLEEQAMAATKLQAARRGHNARSGMRQDREAQEKAAASMQRVHRGKLARVEQQQQQVAAANMQRLHRGRQGRKELEIRKAQGLLALATSEGDEQ